MIFPRSNIFIVFASEHIHLMQSVADQINSAYENDSIAVKADSLNTRNLGIHGPTALYDELNKRMKAASGSIILYTPYIPKLNISSKKPRAENETKYMPKPNIVFEIGMLFQILPKDKIKFLIFPKADLFSDINGLSFPAQITRSPESIDTELAAEIQICVSEYLNSNFSKLDKNPLKNVNYIPNYSSGYVDRKYSNEDIMQTFISQLDKLDEIDQKIVFIAERMLFMGIMKKLRIELVSKISEYKNIEGITDIQEISLNVLNNVFHYLYIRQTERLANQGKNIYIYEYSNLLAKWEDLKELLSTPEIIDTINPLIPMLYFDYYGLTLHKYISLNMDNPEYLEDITEKAELAENNFSEALIYAAKVDTRAGKYWRGHLIFDRARLYSVIYNMNIVNKSEKYQIDDIKKSCLTDFEEVMTIRKVWYDGYYNLANPLKLELQCEYFYAGIDYLNVVSKFNTNTNLLNINVLSKNYSDWTQINNDSVNDLVNAVANKFKN